ncbi:MAG: alanine racemase [Acidobacteriota bacterium]
MKRTWAEISLARLQRNFQAIRQAVGERVVIAVVKADAYGHGLAPVAEALWRAGARWFGVADLGEARVLRSRLPEAAILVFGGCPPERAEEFRRLDLRAAVFREDWIPPGVPVHLKVETGMGRLGLDEAAARRVARQAGGQVEGIFSTMAAADSSLPRTREQLQRFRAVAEAVKGMRHIANSASLAFPEAWLDAVRPGLALYGWCARELPFRLEPILRWKARVLAVNELPAGSPVGYGGRFVTARPSRIAVLAVGYADGYRRAFSNRAVVLTDQGPAPVVGNVSMDLTAIDVTELPAVRPDSEVVLLDWDPASPVSAWRLAEAADTIPYEILAGLGSRVERRYVDEAI